MSAVQYRRRLFQAEDVYNLRLMYRGMRSLVRHWCLGRAIRVLEAHRQRRQAKAMLAEWHRCTVRMQQVRYSAYDLSNRSWLRRLANAFDALRDNVRWERDNRLFAVVHAFDALRENAERRIRKRSVPRWRNNRLMAWCLRAWWRWACDPAFQQRLAVRMLELLK